MSENNAPKVIGLFSGCGGLDYGFQQAGFQIIYANDIAKSVKDTYEFNLGHPIEISDIHDVNKKRIPQGDIVLAGIPCQPFSNAGKRESTGAKDGNLFTQVMAVVQAQRRRPRVIVFENVRGFLSSKDDEGVLMTDRFTHDMEAIGYKVTFQLLNAANFGVPSNRYRVFIICVDRRIKVNFLFPSPPIFAQPVTVGEVLARGELKDEEVEVWDLPPSSRAIVGFITEGGSWKDVPYEYLPDRHKRIRDQMKKYHSPNFYRRFARHEVMGTITATSSPENSGILHPLEDRRYSVREIARFQSYPDSFKFKGNSAQKKYHMIGNSVPPLLAYEVAMAIKTQLFSDYF